jgi:Domain of unknown function (DUF4352)
MLSRDGDRRDKYRHKERGRRGQKGPRSNVRGWTALVVAIASIPALAATGCSAPSEPSRDGRSLAAAERARPAVAIRVGEEFRNGSFELRVTKVQTGLTEYQAGIGAGAARSRNGQFVVAHVAARNVGMSPTPFGTRRHRMVDTTGRRFVPESVRGFDYHIPINPEATTRGIIVFDVAKAAVLATLVVQTDDHAYGPDAVTVVDVWLPHAVPPRYRPAPGRLR